MADPVPDTPRSDGGKPLPSITLCEWRDKASREPCVDISDQGDEPIYSKAYADELARRFNVDPATASHIVRQVVLDYLESETPRLIEDITKRLTSGLSYGRNLSPRCEELEYCRCELPRYHVGRHECQHTQPNRKDADPTDQTKGRSSDGEHCQDCGETYGDFVYRVPDDVWALITPKPDQPGAGLLCPTCAARRATDAGIYLEWAAARG